MDRTTKKLKHKIEYLRLELEEVTEVNSKCLEKFNQDFAGDFVDQFSARAGFVWQLGESNKPTQISMNQRKEMELKISNLEKDNKELKNKNNKIISQNEKLLARLEKLENIAFKLQKNDGLKLSQGILE